MDQQPTSRDRFASAALRHLRHAEALGSDPHPAAADQAWHLVGFAPECARKAAFATEWAGRALGHALGMRGDELATWLSSLEPLSHRYRAGSAAPQLGALQQWGPEARYDLTGTTRRDRRPLREALNQAEGFVATNLASLWVDGLIRTGREQL